MLADICLNFQEFTTFNFQRSPVRKSGDIVIIFFHGARGWRVEHCHVEFNWNAPQSDNSSWVIGGSNLLLYYYEYNK